MNNKGQVLTAFIILLPLILMLFTIVLDVGMLYTEKRRVDNNVKSTINYGLKHIEDETLKSKLTKLLTDNIDDIDSVYIDIEQNKITINLVKTQKSIFNAINLKKSYEIKSNYVGYINEDKIKLIKE